MDVERLRAVALPQDPVPLRITIPAKVAFDIGAIHKVIDNFARAIGCEKCYSGASCFFQMERDFVVDPAKLDVISVGHR